MNAREGDTLTDFLHRPARVLKKVGNFAREYVETLQACASIGNTARLDEMLCSWKATAEVYADPNLLAKLTRPLPAPTGKRVSRP